MKNKMIKAASILAAGVLAFSLTACSTETETDNSNTDTTTEDTTNTDINDDADNTADDSADNTDATTEGASITIEVTDAEGNTSSYTGTTDAENLLDAIADIDGVTVDGYTSDWGYYVTTVNDVVADYDADGAYWSIYVNGEYGQYGVDTQPIADGDTYALIYEVYSAVEGVSFTIEVTDAEGNTTSYQGYSSDEFLFDALDDVEEGFTYDGYESDWGYYITTVNDTVADYDTDGAYWSLYVNGEYGMNGVSTEPLVDGNVYSFVYEVYAAN